MRNMPMLRKIAKSILGLLFTLSLVLTVQVYSLIDFTQPDNLGFVINGIIGDKVPDGSVPEDVKAMINDLKAKCSGKSELVGEFNVRELVLECSDVNALEEDGDVRTLMASAIADSIYYRDYGCSFVDCIKNWSSHPQVIISKTAHDFYSSILIYMVAATVLAGAAFLAAIEGANSKMKSLGFALLWTSLPFFLIGTFAGDVLDDFVPEGMSASVKSVMNSITSPTYPIYVYLLVAGFVLVFAGYFVKKENFRFSRQKSS